MTRSSLLASLTDLTVELWHNDRFQKDEHIGDFTVDLQEVLNSDITRTSESVIRVLDVWLRENFAQVRLLLYLEDLGPKDQAAVNAIPKANNDWEVQMWRKAEETKFVAGLKARESEHLQKVAAEWIEKESRREMQNEKTIVELSGLEIKLRARVLELQKRENKIAAIEEDYKVHMADMQKQIEIKEEELNMNKNRLSELKNNSFKESKILKNEIQQKKEEASKVEEEIIKIRKQSESQESRDLKKELNARNLENIDLVKKYEQIREIKESFEQKLVQLKDDLGKTLRMHDYERKQRNDKEREEITKRRLELEATRFQHEEALQIKDLKEKMITLRSRLK